MTLKAIFQKKQIEITEVSTSTRENELALKVGFRLLPSRTSFSSVTANLFFDEEKTDSLHLRIIQGPLATDEYEITLELDMTGIEQGQHTLRVEMYELWASSEKLTSTSKQATIDYVPVRREDRLVKVPMIRSSTGESLAIVSGTQKSIYREMEEAARKELNSKKDEW